MGESVRAVAVVGDDGLGDAVRANGGTVVSPSDADAIAAVGERAIVESRAHAAPILPIGVGRYAVGRTAADAAIDQLLAGNGRRVAHPDLAVSVGGDPAGRALFDVSLVTSEPARISEYGVAFPSGRETSFRADAVVVATPVGSDGYAHAAGGPVIAPETGVSVVPVSPFTTQTDTWVVPGRVTLSVERDAEPVTLVVDGEATGTVPPNEPIRIDASDRVSLLSVPATRGGE